MTMPTWNQTMYPTLKLLSDKQLHTNLDLRETLIESFEMNPEEQHERLSKSGQLTISNRLNWGLTHMRKANLIKNGEKKGTYFITDEGAAFLKKYPNGFDQKEIEYVPAHIAWKHGYQESSPKTKDKPSSQDFESETPEEQMVIAFNQLNDALADDLLDKIMGKSAYSFERLVTDLVEKLGYGDLSEGFKTVTSKSGDGGIDGIVRLDRLGFDSVYIQAKRWKADHTVGSPDLQAFVGALVGNGATKGLFITTSKFSNEARKYAEESMKSSNVNLVLIDGTQLAKLMIDCGVGVSEKTHYVLKAIDNDYFDEL